MYAVRAITFFEWDVQAKRKRAGSSDAVTEMQ